MGTVAEQLAEWIVSLGYDDSPPRVLERARYQIVNVMASLYAGTTSRDALSVVEAVRGWSAPGPCTLIPFGDKLRDYFHKYESGQRTLDAIIQSLYAGQDELQKDNASLEQEKANIWSIKGRLEMIIPPTCWEICRGRPAICSARSQRSRQSGAPTFSAKPGSLPISVRSAAAE